MLKRSKGHVPGSSLEFCQAVLNAVQLRGQFTELISALNVFCLSLWV